MSLTGHIRPLTAFFLLICVLSGCHPPLRKSSARNACSFLNDNPRINRYLLHYAPTPSQQALILAFIRHESNFNANARPVKQWLITGWIPWTFYSSARGYAQITDATWKDFNAAQYGKARRYAMIDHIHFINWYFLKHQNHLTDPSDYYESYFLYHDGPTGYHQKKYRRSHSLHRYSLRVAQDAKLYRKQLTKCQEVLRWQNRWQQF